MDYIPTYSDSLHADIQPSYSDSLMHHGIKGMHWGVRRYQNKNGSLTNAGKSRYGQVRTKSSNPIFDWVREKKEYSETKNQINKLSKQGSLDKNFKNRGKLEKQIMKEMENDKDIKDFIKFDREIFNALQKMAKEQGIDVNKIALSGQAAKEYGYVRNDAHDASKRIAQKHLDSYASALLKDLNIKETEGGHRCAVDVLMEDGYLEAWGY